MSQHPGRILLDGFLAPLGVSASRLASGIGVDRSTVSRLIDGSQSITPAMAAKLGAFFGVPARWWLHMQADWDADQLDAGTEHTRAVQPLPPHADFLLTPEGALSLLADEPGRGEAGPRVVTYANGAVALVSE
jgi:antitoxin HigA-1